MTKKTMRISPRVKFLVSFALAGLWAGSIVLFLVVPSPVEVYRTAEIHRSLETDTVDAEEARRRLFDRQGNKREKRTTPYEEKTAPQFEQTPGVDSEDGPGFQFPSVNTPAGDAPVETVGETESATDQITGVFDSLKALLNGEGNFGDIVKIAITAFALFGGGSTIASDGFFKIILSLFSGKASYNEILNKSQKPSRRARRRARRK